MYFSDGKYIITASGKDWQEIAEELNRRQIKFFQSESGVEIDGSNSEFRKMLLELGFPKEDPIQSVGVNGDGRSSTAVGDGKPVSTHSVDETLVQKLERCITLENGEYVVKASGNDFTLIEDELRKKGINVSFSPSTGKFVIDNNSKYKEMLAELKKTNSVQPVGVNSDGTSSASVGDGKPVSPHSVDDEAPTRRYSMSGKQEPYSGFGDAFNAGLNDVDDAFPDFEDAFKKGMTASTDADEISDRIMRVLTAGILSGEITREGAKAFFKENGLVLQDVEYEAIYDAIKEYKTIDKAIKEDVIVRTKFQELASHFRQKFSADSLSPLPKKTMDSLYKLGREKCNLSPEEVDAFVKKTASIHFYTENGKPVLTVGRQRLGYTRAEFARKILEDAAGDPGYINDIKNFIKTEGTRFYLLPVSDVDYDAGGHFSPASGEVVLRNNKWVSGTVRHEFIHATLDKNEKLSKLYEESHIAATYVNEAVAKTSNLYHDDNAILNGIKEYHITAVKKEFPDLSEYEQLLKAEKRARADYATLLLSTQSERRAFLENYRKKGIITLDNDSFRWEFGMLNSEIDGWQMCYTKQAATHHLDTFDKMGAQSVLDEIFDGRAKISDQFVIENAVNARFNKWTTVISGDGKRKYFYSGKREDLLPEIEQAYADRCHFDDKGRFWLEVTDENEYHELKNKKIVRDSTPKDGRINWLTKLFDEDFELHFDRMHSYTDGAIDIDVSHLSPDEIEATIDRYEKQGITVRRRGDNFLEIRDAQSLAKLNEIVEELSPESITVDKNRVFYRKFPKNAGNLKMYIDVHKIPYFEDGESIYISDDYICDKHKPLQAARSDVVTGYKLDPNDKTMAQQALLLQRAGLGKIEDGVYFSSQNAHRFTDLKKDLPKLIKAKTDVFARAAFVPVRFPNKRPGAKTPYIETYKMLTDHLPETEVKKITSEMGRYGIEFKTGPDGSLVMTERSAVVYDMVRTAQASKKLTPEDLLKAKSRMMKIDIDSNSGKRKFFKKTMKALNKTGKVLDVATAYGLAFDEDFWNKLGDGDLVGYAAEIGEAILEIPSMVHTLYYNRDEVFTRENMSEFATSVGEQVLDAPGAVGVGINRSVSKIFTGSDWWIEGGIDVYGKDGKREWSDGYNMVATGDFDVSVDEANVQTEHASFINYGVKNGQIKNGYMESVTWGFLPSSKSIPIASESEHPIGGLATSGLVGAYIESQYLRPARYQENTLDGVLRMAIRKPGTQMTDAAVRGIISGKNVDVSDAFEIAAEYRIEEGRVTSQRQQHPDGSISVHYYDNKDVTFNHNGSTQNELTALWGDVNNKDLKNIKIGNRTHTVRVSPDTRNLKFYKRDEETGDYIFCEEFSRYKDEEYPVGTTDVNGARNEARYKRLETKYTKYYRIKAEDMVYTPEYARAKGNARGNNPRKMSVDDFIKPDITGHVEFDLALQDGRIQPLVDENGKPISKTETRETTGIRRYAHIPYVDPKIGSQPAVAQAVGNPYIERDRGRYLVSDINYSDKTETRFSSNSHELRTDYYNPSEDALEGTDRKQVYTGSVIPIRGEKTFVRLHLDDNGRLMAYENALTGEVFEGGDMKIQQKGPDEFYVEVTDTGNNPTKVKISPQPNVSLHKLEDGRYAASLGPNPVLLYDNEDYPYGTDGENQPKYDDKDVPQDSSYQFRYNKAKSTKHEAWIDITHPAYNDNVAGVVRYDRRTGATCIMSANELNGRGVVQYVDTPKNDDFGDEEWWNDPQSSMYQRIMKHCENMGYESLMHDFNINYQTKKGPKPEVAMVNYLLQRHKQWCTTPEEADETLFKRFIADLKNNKNKKELTPDEKKLLARLYASGHLTKEDVAELKEKGFDLPDTAELKKQGEADIQKTNPQQNENPDASGHLATNATVVEGQSADTPANQKTGPTVQPDHQND